MCLFRKNINPKTDPWSKQTSVRDDIPEVCCFDKPPPGFCARWSLKTWILSGTCKHFLLGDTNCFVWLSEQKQKQTNSRCSVGVTLTFVWVIELEDVGPGRVIWQHHHPSVNTHPLTGAGLVLRRTPDHTQQTIRFTANVWKLHTAELSQQH